MHKNGWRNGKVVAVPTTFKGKRFTRLKASHRRTIATSSIYKAGVKPKKRFPESRAYLLKNRNKTHDDVYLGWQAKTSEYLPVTIIPPLTDIAIHSNCRVS